MDFKERLTDPSGAYGSPQEVLEDSELSKDQKIKLLEQWRYDQLELEVADQENMQGEKPNKLGEINSLLSELKDDS